MSITQQDIEKIHQTTLAIMEKTGVSFLNSTALDMFKKAGAKTNGSRVYFTPQLIEQSLENCPKTISLKGLNGQSQLVLGAGNKYCAPITGAVFVMDEKTGRRKAVSQDYVNFVKLAQISSMFQIIGGPIVIPSDLPEETHTAFIMSCLFKYSDKVLLGHGLNGESARESLSMAKIFLGDSQDYYMLGMPSITSPLVLDRDAVEVIFHFAREGQPVIAATCGIAGFTCPVTLAGTLAVTNAEILAGIVLAQLVRPGAPVIYGNISVAGDMQTMGIGAGAAESALLTKGAAQMANFYGLPCRAGGNLTNAIHCDIQAGYESMLSLFSALASPSDIIIHGAGMLEAFMTVSYEKFIMDEDIFLLAKRYLEGIKVNDDTLALHEILEKGPGGNYLDSPHTFTYFRSELALPLVSNRKSYENWALDGRSPIDAAREVWQGRLSRYQHPEPSGNFDQILRYWKNKYGDLPPCLR